LRTALGFVIALVFLLTLGAGAVEQPAAGAAGPPVSIFSLPASDSVFATIATSEDRLLLLVLWRGSPRWYSTNKGSQGGGSGTMFSSTVSFEGGQVSVSFDTATKKALVQGKAVSMRPNKNVILVDGVDGARGGGVVRTLAIDTTGLKVGISNGFPGLVPIFSRSPAIVEFLQCGAKQTDPRSVMPCALLKKK
jgi:hypothetical protein